MKKKSFFIVLCAVIMALVFSATVWAVSEKIGLFDKPAKVNEAEVEDIDETVSNMPEQGISQNKTATDNALSAEDTKVKAEIAKYSADSADFRYSRNESIAERSFDLTFEKVGYIGGDEKERITYKNNSGDEFVYDIQSGKLFFAQISSLETKKGADSIDSAAAKKVALDYADKQGATADYRETYFKENDRGYTFVFSRFVSGYRTSETIEATVGFNGEIVGVRNNTAVFEGKELSVDADSVKEKINTELERFENGVAKDMWLDVYNGKLVLNCQIGYEKNGSSQGAVAVIPIE